MSTITASTRLVKAPEAKPGQWIVYANSRMNQRIIDVSGTRDGQVRIHADYGNGGEPATLFYDSFDNIRVSDSNGD